MKQIILGPNLCSAVPKRSAIDLTKSLLFDIEDAWNGRQFDGILAIDVKGAFDDILINRLLLSLGEQGWPNPVDDLSVLFPNSPPSGFHARVYVPYRDSHSMRPTAEFSCIAHSVPTLRDASDEETQ